MSDLFIVMEVPDAELARKAGLVDEAQRSGLARVAEATQQLLERKVGDIRRRRIPSREEAADYRRAHENKTSRTREIVRPNDPEWEPTGALENAVAAAPEWEGTARVDITADVAHALPRDQLGVSWFPQHPAIGVIRKNEFAEDTVRIIEPQVPDLFADGFNEVFER